MIIVSTLLICLCMIACTAYLITAISNLMAAIARHNMHMEDIKKETGRIGTMFSNTSSAVIGLANYYKRSEDEKRVG